MALLGDVAGHDVLGKVSCSFIHLRVAGISRTQVGKLWLPDSGRIDATRMGALTALMKATVCG